MKNNDLDEITQIYLTIKDKIEFRLNEFSEIWANGTDDDIFVELIFCILTPQSKAKSCWRAVQNLIEKNLLLDGSESQIAKELYGIRFHNNKAKYIVCSREFFTSEDRITIKKHLSKFNDILKAREWLVQNIKGFGFKEASHFLRNIGFGKNISILDRHILKNLKLLKVVDEIPRVLSKPRYLEIENRMKIFSETIKIPLIHLDFVLWFKEAGEILK